jgi:hypothetical protein
MTKRPAAAQVERLITVLEQIRDRLPTPPQQQPATVLFGYTFGQDPAPTDAQVELARLFLRGKLHDQSRWLMPAAAWDVAREIVEREHDHSPPVYDLGDGAGDRCVKCGRPY